MRAGALRGARAHRSDGRSPLIALDGVGVRFGGEDGFEAVRDVSLDVREGEFVSILGRSGCGKSTLFNVIAGLLEATNGAVKYDGKDVNGKPGHAGYMLQRDHLFPWRTVRDNVIVGLDVLGRRRKESRKRASELFPRFGLAGFEDFYPAALSGGMRQRAALLRTMLLDRDVLLLDEPFGALDAITRAEMQSWLLEIWGESRQTVLFITHDVEEAIFLADRVVVMSGPPGHVVVDREVDIPRPRAYADVVTSDAFIALKHEMLDVIAQPSA